jgi:putative endonuclease
VAALAVGFKGPTGRSPATTRVVLPGGFSTFLAESSNSGLAAARVRPMPAKHPADRGELGRRGEALACARLTAAGLRIVARNWRCPTGEIDVVTEAPGLLVFCEVKTRRGVGYGTPAAAVDAAKQAQLRRLAGAYLRTTPHRPSRVRFDVVTVVWPRQGQPRVEHLEGVL